MAQLIDTNILIYRVDPRFPEKQEIATKLLEKTVQNGERRIPHQAIVEFYAAATRPLSGLGAALLTSSQAREEVETLLLISPILYPTENILRLALYGVANVWPELVRCALMGVRRTLSVHDPVLRRFPTRSLLRVG